MKGLAGIRRHLGWKLFLSYLVIVVVGVVSLIVTAELQAPASLARHTAHMQAMMGSSMSLVVDLTQSFRRAVNEVLAVAAAAALLAAVIVSTFVTRRIVGPIRAMTEASQRIAAGDYQERIVAPGEDEVSSLAESFNQMAQQLQQTEERRRQLIGDVAHELRTPLSSMRIVMEGLVDGVLPAEPGAFYDVQRELRRLQRLVDDLEELSRAEAGQIPLRLQPVPPQSFVHTAANRLRPQYEDKGVSLEVALPASLPPVLADGERMTQVMLNLLGNALQYTPEGGHVSVQAAAGAQTVTLTVADTGIGLAPEQVAHIFERFYRVDKSRSRSGGGSGIGLTISKHLLEAHRGTIVAESDGLGQGSRFIVTLPQA